MSKTNVGLVDYCKKLLNSGNTIYCLGTWGQVLTETVLNQKCNQYSFNKNNKARISQGLGKKAFDCCGIIKGYLWDEKYDASTDENEAMMLSRAKTKGKIGTLPEVIGTLVFMSGHVGVYIGNGEVIECTPAWNSYAVIKTKLSQRKWTDWAYYNRISYDTNAKPEVAPTDKGTAGIIADIQRGYNSKWGSLLGRIAEDNIFGPDTKKHLVMALQQELNVQYGAGLDRDGSFGPLTKNAFRTIKKGARGNITWLCQAMLYIKGYNPNGLDHIFGNGMYDCVVKYQREKGLEVDGIIGKNTAYSLFN